MIKEVFRTIKIDEISLLNLTFIDNTVLFKVNAVKNGQHCLWHSRKNFKVKLTISVKNQILCLR